MLLCPTIKSIETPNGRLYRRRSVSHRLPHFRSSRYLCCKAMLLVLAMVVLDIGIPPIDDTDSGASFPESFGFILPVSANSDPCMEFDIPKPLRFGKREAYISRYRNSNKCNNKRVSLNDLQSEQIRLRQFLEELNRANINPQSLNKIPSSEVWQKIMRSYRLGALGAFFRPQNSDPVANKKESTELLSPNDFSDSSYSTIN